MKKVLKAVGLIVLLLAIYFAAQVVVTLAISIGRVAATMFTALAANTTPELGKITDDLVSFVGTQTPWVLLVAVALTVPTYYLFYRGRKQELREFVSTGNLHPAAIPALIIFGLSLNFLIDLILAFLSQLGAMKQVFDSYNKVAELLFNGSFFLSLLAVGIVGPIFEELLFRGLVFGELRKLMPVRIAIFVQAILFGVYHMNVIQGTYAFLIGILLGFVYYRSRSIYSPVIVHITINSSSVIAGRLIGGASSSNYALIVASASILLFILSGAFILTHRGFRHAMDDSLYTLNRAGQSDPPEVGGTGNTL